MPGHRRAARRAQLTLAVSQAVRRYYLDRTGLAPETCQVLYNGLDLVRFSDVRALGRAFREELGIPADALVVGNVGRLSQGKGQEAFLHAAAVLSRGHPGVRFLLVGDGGRREGLERLAGELQIDPAVCFAGHRDDVPAALGAMDVFWFTGMPEVGGRIQDGLPRTDAEKLLGDGQAPESGDPVKTDHEQDNRSGLPGSEREG